MSILPQLLVNQRSGLALFAPSAERVGSQWPCRSLVETVVDDVHASADAPLGPWHTARGVEDGAIRLVELDAEVVEDRAPEPFEIGGRSVHQFRQVANPMPAHEGGETAALDVLRRWPPGDLTAELELVHTGELYNSKLKTQNSNIVCACCADPCSHCLSFAF
jgi:hypothetical protein